jgi:hypothetical protein
MLKQLFEKIFGTKPQPVVEAPAPAGVVQTNTITVPVSEPASTIVIPEVVVEAPAPAPKPAPKKKTSWESVDKKAPAKPAASKRSRIAKPAAPKRKPKTQA